MHLFSPPKLQGKYVQDVLKSGWLTTGPMCERLKEKVAEFIGANKYQIVLASSATAGVQGILDILRRQPRCLASNVYCTTATFPGVLQAIHHAGFHHVGVPAATQIETDIGGRRLYEPCNQLRPKPVVRIHDACHSWQPDLDFDFAFMSFYPTKLVPGAEGGAVYCKSLKDAIQLERHLYCGLRPGKAGDGMAPVCRGRKANMTDVAAALNLEALELAPRHIERTERTWEQMADLLARVGVNFRRQPTRPYLMQVIDEYPRQLMKRLAAKGISSAWNFPPSSLVTIPCHPGLEWMEMRKIVEVVSGL